MGGFSFRFWRLAWGNRERGRSRFGVRHIGMGGETFASWVCLGLDLWLHYKTTPHLGKFWEAVK